MRLIVGQSLRERRGGKAESGRGGAEVVKPKNGSKRICSWTEVVSLS